MNSRIDGHSKIFLGIRLTLISNGMKDIMRVITSLEKRGILLKGTARKIAGQEGGLFNFLGPLMKTGLPLMKNVLTPLVKSVLIPLGLRTAISAANVAIKQSYFCDLFYDFIHTIKRRSG